MRDLESLVLVGPPRSGKDTLASGIDGDEFKDRVVRPTRWATRPYHSAEQSSAWTHKSHKEFKEGIAQGMISPWWTRALDIGEDPEYYGFLSVPPDDTRLKIYSANYPILERPNAGTQAVLAKAAIVLVDAESETLHARLAEIPEMPTGEREARARKIDQRAPQLHRPMIGIYTDGMQPHEGQEHFRQLVRAILDDCWRPIGYKVGDLPQHEPDFSQRRSTPLHTDRPGLGQL